MAENIRLYFFYTMENLFDQFDIYIDSFCKCLQEQVDAIAKNASKENVFICAISRKTPKLLDLLRNKLAPIWDKVTVFTEIAIPFMDWSNIRQLILIDDAIYYGSTFTAIYQQILEIAPDVTIIPMCCVRASEANLTIDNDLKTTLVSRNKGHYFVNCLSRRFREQCLPFEVEFPVFRIETQEKGEQKALRLYDLLKNVISTTYHIGETCNEIGIDFSADGSECNKLRFYVREGELLISSICTQPMLQENLDDRNLFADTYLNKPWLMMMDEISRQPKNAAYYQTLCMACNFFYSISLFMSKWNVISDAIESAFGLKKVTVDLRQRELDLLFGRDLSSKIYEWYVANIEVDNLFVDGVYLAELEEMDFTEEYVPKNLMYWAYYHEVQERFLTKFHNVAGILLALLYIQNFMLDKMNRRYYLVNNERLKYGHTFGSLTRLLENAGLGQREDILKMHAWVDAHIDSACIVPQYIKVENLVGKEVWTRVFRSGENEMHFVSHWARLGVDILRKEMEITGLQRMDLTLFSGLLAWVFRKFQLDEYFGDGATCVYEAHRYCMKVKLGELMMDVCNVMEQLEIIQVNNRLVELNENLLDEELMSGSILPDSIVENIHKYLDDLGHDVTSMDEPWCFVPYFDARLYADKKSPGEDLLQAFFGLLGRFVKEEAFSTSAFLKQAKNVQIDLVRTFSHHIMWYERHRNDTDKDLATSIQSLNEAVSYTGLGVLLNVVKMTLGKNNEARLLKYVKDLNNPRLKFLQDTVAGMSSSGLSTKNLLQRILDKGYQVWMF